MIRSEEQPHGLTCQKDFLVLVRAQPELISFGEYFVLQARIFKASRSIDPRKIRKAATEAPPLAKSCQIRNSKPAINVPNRFRSAA